MSDRHFAFWPKGHPRSMSGPLFTGATVVLLPRWDREAAARLIERYKVGAWTSIPTMVVDFLSNPRLGEYDLSSIQRLRAAEVSLYRHCLIFAGRAWRIMDIVG